MLDKSVPYVDVLMRRKKGSQTPVFDLPAGYKFSLFRAGDEHEWAKIETSVLEFPDEAGALAYFQESYLPRLSELEKRCLFVENDAGEKVATSTAYGLEYPDPWLHWVAVMPQYQGLGLGKAIISKITQLMIEIEGDRDFYLHTQTWSHKAIRIYEKFGYEIMSERNIGGYTNENYDQAIAILNSIYNPE